MKVAIDLVDLVISGFWPAESNKEYRWSYYYYGVNEEGWKHLQQEMCWIQTPNADHRRVFLWGDTKIKQFSSGDTTTNLGLRYQVYDANGKRGVMVLDPLTGDFWFPAILSNAAGGQDDGLGREHAARRLDGGDAIAARAEADRLGPGEDPHAQGLRVAREPLHEAGLPGAQFAREEDEVAVLEEPPEGAADALGARGGGRHDA